MGLFGKLFEKKECAICGGEIGLLGNRKLEDGNMCKDCAKKLSPFFDDRRHSTVEQIKKQLEYREENRKELANFNPTRSISSYDQVLIEERGGVPYRFVVSDAKDWRKENPDIVLFKDVSDIKFDVRKFEHELTYKDEDGETKSYFPRRYEYKYDFFAKLIIANNPYFDDITVKMNRATVEIVSEKIGGVGLFNNDKQDHTYHPQYRIYQQMFEELQNAVLMGKNGSPKAAPVPQAAPAAGPKFCPGCGAPTSGGRFCENCGTKLF